MNKAEATKLYSEAAKAVRANIDPAKEAELHEACAKAEAVFRSFEQPQVHTKEGWYNLPIAKACWEGDARDLRAA